MLEVKVELSEIGRLETIIRCKTEMMERAAALAEKVTAAMGGESVSSSKSNDPMGDATSEKVDLKREIDALQKELSERKHRLSGLIDTLEKPQWIDVLYGVHINRKKRADLAVEMGYSASYIGELHDVAIRELEKKWLAAKHPLKSC